MRPGFFWKTSPPQCRDYLYCMQEILKCIDYSYLIARGIVLSGTYEKWIRHGYGFFVIFAWQRYARCERMQWLINSSHLRLQHYFLVREYCLIDTAPTGDMLTYISSNRILRCLPEPKTLSEVLTDIRVPNWKLLSNIWIWMSGENDMLSRYLIRNLVNQPNM